MRPQVVLVTGSRELLNPAQVHAALRDFPPGTILIHGACRGADEMCRRFAEGRDWVVWGFPYFEDEEGRETRNASMVAMGVALRDKGHIVSCFAFPTERRSVGTWKCIRLMKAASFVVRSAYGDPF